jgi:hypothetical protein
MKQAVPTDNWHPRRSGDGFILHASSKEHEQKRLERRSDENRKKGKRSQQVARVARLGPMPDPMAELLKAARAGDADAIRRANALYGSSWKRAAKG